MLVNAHLRTLFFKIKKTQNLITEKKNITFLIFSLFDLKLNFCVAIILLHTSIFVLKYKPWKSSIPETDCM